MRYRKVKKVRDAQAGNAAVAGAVGAAIRAGAMERKLRKILKPGARRVRMAVRLAKETRALAVADASRPKAAARASATAVAMVATAPLWAWVTTCRPFCLETARGKRVPTSRD